MASCKQDHVAEHKQNRPACSAANSLNTAFCMENKILDFQLTRNYEKNINNILYLNVVKFTPVYKRNLI